MDIGNPTRRRAPGQVARTILIAITVTIGSQDILETWLYERSGSRLADADFECRLRVPASGAGFGYRLRAHSGSPRIATGPTPPHHSTWGGIRRPTRGPHTPQSTTPNRH